MGQVQRRRFLLATGVLLAAPVASLAQDATRYRVAMVFTTSPLSEMLGPQPNHPGVRAFLETLQASGYTPGRNLIFEPRSAEGKYDRYPEIFTELLGLRVSVIVTIGEDMTQRAREATSTVPIVMAYSNYPLEAGLVQSLARPGGNVTGVNVSPSAELEAKRLELLKEAVPKISRVAFLGLRSEWESPIGQSVQSAAGRLGVTLYLAENTPSEYGAAFAAMSRDRPDAVFVGNSPVNFGHRNTIVELVTKAKVLATYQDKQFVLAGGLMSYGISVPDQFRRAALIVAKVLKGANPADLPVEQPTKFELIINQRTAKALGINVPRSLLLRADEVIQ
jgi:putative tryptophan/tyrosine transport system substrate-binding protein